MATEAEITAKFWKALKSDMTVMLGVQGVEHDKTQPMTGLGKAGARRRLHANPVRLSDARRALRSDVSNGQDRVSFAHACQIASPGPACHPCRPSLRRRV